MLVFQFQHAMQCINLGYYPKLFNCVSNLGIVTTEFSDKENYWFGEGWQGKETNEACRPMANNNLVQTSDIQGSEA